MPGVRGSRLGGAGIDPVIRGQGQNRLNVMLDGGFVHGGCPNRMDPPSSYASPATYDSVEVIKGSQSVRFSGMSAASVDNGQSVMWPDVDLAQLGAFTEVETALGERDRLKAGLRVDRGQPQHGHRRQQCPGGYREHGSGLPQ